MEEGVRLLLHVRMHFILPHEGVSVEVDRVHPLEAARAFPERAFFPVITAGEGFVVGWMYGPVAAASVLRPVEFKEAVVEGESVAHTVPPSRASFLQRGKRFFHVLVDVGESAFA